MDGYICLKNNFLRIDNHFYQCAVEYLVLVQTNPEAYLSKLKELKIFVLIPLCMKVKKQRVIVLGKQLTFSQIFFLRIFLQVFLLGHPLEPYISQ